MTAMLLHDTSILLTATNNIKLALTFSLLLTTDIVRRCMTLVGIINVAN